MLHHSSSDLLHPASATVSSKLWLILAEFSSSVQYRYLIRVIRVAGWLWIISRDQENWYHVPNRAHIHCVLNLYKPPKIYQLSL